MIHSTDQPGMFQDGARVSTQVIDDMFSFAVTVCLVLTCLLIVPLFVGAYYWNSLLKRGQQLNFKMKSKSKSELQLKGSL
jgi:hypothetical protein